MFKPQTHHHDNALIVGAAEAWVEYVTQVSQTPGDCDKDDFTSGFLAGAAWAARYFEKLTTSEKD